MDAIKEGLFDYADHYEKKNYLFIPNACYIEIESWLLRKETNENKKKRRNTDQFPETNKRNFLGDIIIDNYNQDADVEKEGRNIADNIDGTAVQPLDFNVEMNNMGVNMGAEIEGRNLETEKHSTGAEFEYEKYNIDLQIGTLQRDIDIKNVDIESIRKNIIVLTTEMTEMKNACNHKEKELATLQEQRARKIGHF